MSLLSLETYQDIVTVRLTNGVTNSINPNVVSDFRKSLTDLRTECRGVMFAGGDKFFSMGLNLPELLKLDRQDMANFFYSFSDMLLEIFTLPIPTVCAAKAHCVAAGTTILISCDYRIASTSRTLVGLNEIKLGLPVPYLSDLMLRMVAGDHWASTMLYLGEFIESAKAEQIGILNETCSKEDVEGRAIEKLLEHGKLSTRAFAAAKANRAEVIRLRYKQFGLVKNEEFLDLWFGEEAQGLLQDAAKKF